jgi:hypothetical protein
MLQMSKSDRLNRSSFNDVADSYFKAKEGINKSIKNEINRYDTHLRNTLGKKEPKKITPLELENLQQIKLKTLAVSTTKHIIELLRTITRLTSISP